MLWLCKKDAFQNKDFSRLNISLSEKKLIQANNRLDFHRSLRVRSCGRAQAHFKNSGQKLSLSSTDFSRSSRRGNEVCKVKFEYVILSLVQRSSVTWNFKNTYKFFTFSAKWHNRQEICTVLLKTMGANTLQTVFELFIYHETNLSYLTFPDLVSDNNQFYFIGLLGNDYCIFTETVQPIYLLYRYLDYFVQCFYFVWLEVVCSCQECFGESAVEAVSSRRVVSMAKSAVRIVICWGVVGQVNVISSSECRAIPGIKT